MTRQINNSIQYLIPDILPLDHVSLSSKRIKFIKGQGAIIHDDCYAVEMYIPNNSDEQPVFFGVQKHFGKPQLLSDYFRKLKVMRYDDINVSESIRAKFEEALFQFEPFDAKEKLWVMPEEGRVCKIEEAKEVYFAENLSGAA